MRRPNYQEPQTRFVAFRYDGERTLSGVVMPYGQTATPWEGFQERFEPGAFGDVSREDIILNQLHDRRKPLARSQGAEGGLLELEDSPTALRIRATIAESTAGNDTLELVRQNILRGFSIEFRVQEFRKEIRHHDCGAGLAAGCGRCGPSRVY